VFEPAVQITLVVVAAVGSGWLADRMRIPAILPLLAVGILLGPVGGVLDPDGLVGTELLIPLVGLAVGVILFEGGLSLRIAEIEGSQRVIWRLVTVGAAVTWITATAAARLLLDIGLGAAVVLGSILVVSGPTVVGPVLRTVRPSRKVGSILKWESIFIDPVGAMLAVIAFDVVVAGAARPSLGSLVAEVAAFTAIGIGVGGILSVVAIFALRRHWVPEHLISLFGLALALVAYALSNEVVHESGLLATTVLGLVLANHRRIKTESLVRFSEVLRVLLIGVLFIVLSARLSRDQLASIGWGAVGLVLVLVLVARPLSVWASTIGSDFTARQRVLIAGVAPRGIVAASIASVFGLELEEAGVAGAELLTPVVFAVIIATVLIYGLGAGPLARALGLARKGQEGVLVLGAGTVERALGQALSDAGVEVVLATINRNDERGARMAGLRTYYGNILDEDVDLRLEMSGIGRLMALTPNDEVNALASRRFSDLFGGGEVYQLSAMPPPPGVEGTVVDLGGRQLFGESVNYPALRKAITEGSIRRTAISEKFDSRAFSDRHGDDAVPLLAVRDGRLLVSVVDSPTSLLDRLQPGDQLLWLPIGD